MRAIHTWMFIAATILIGLAAGISANADEFRIKITTKNPGSTYYAVTADRRIVAVVCWTKHDWFGAKEQRADLVFPTDDGELKVNVKEYRGSDSDTPQRVRIGSVAKPAYRPLSAENATQFCDDPNGYYQVTINDEEAKLQKTGTVTAQSFGVSRRAL